MANETTTIPSPAFFNPANAAAPTAPTTPVAPVVNAAPAAPVAPTPVVNLAPATEVKEKKEKKEKKPKEAQRNIEPEDIQYIMANISAKPIGVIAEERGLTKNQANRVISDIRTMLRKAVLAKDANAYPATGEMNKKGEPIYDYSSPMTPAADRVEVLIAAKLSRPEGSVGGNKGGGGKVKSAINDAFASLFAEIGV